MDENGCVDASEYVTKFNSFTKELGAERVLVRSGFGDDSFKRLHCIISFFEIRVRESYN